MHQYLETLVSNSNLSFSPEMQRNMFELYLDIGSMFLNNETSLTAYITQSDLWDKMSGAAGKMDTEIQRRVAEMTNQMNKKR